MKHSEEDLRAIRLACLRDPVKFARTFFPHIFIKEIPWFHHGLLAIMTRQTGFLRSYGHWEKLQRNFVWKENPVDPKSQEHPLFVEQPDGTIAIVGGEFSLAMIPRGFAKTTITNIASIFRIVYRISKVIVYLSEAAKHAETQLQFIKNELETNERLRLVFGNLAPDSSSGLTWRQDEIETLSGTTIICRGRGGQVRGINIKSNRPDYIVLDDVEDEESVNTEDQRKKCIDWVYRSVLPALSRFNTDAMVVALGTLLHREAMLMTLLRDERFTSIRLGAYDRDGELLWPDLMSEDALQTIKQGMQNAANLSGFYLEYMNEARATEEQIFRQSYIQYGTPKGYIRNVIAIDPALSPNRNSSRASIAVVGMSENGEMVVQESWGERGQTVRQLVDRYFEMKVRWDCVKCGVESIGFQAALIHLLREEMFRKAKTLGPKAYFEIEPILHSTKKAERIKGVLQPRYAAGYVWHRQRFPALETQMLDFTLRTEDGIDDLDAVAMAVALLDPFAADAAGVDLGKDEYEPLEAVGGSP